KSVLQLRDPRTVRKVAMLDDHVCLAFATAPDIRSHSGRTNLHRQQCHSHSHRLTVGDPVTVEYIMRQI
ncbi:hypothetical protein EV359DRAFT_52464, partial [Lentinula novae-zelandiae]